MNSWTIRAVIAVGVMLANGGSATAQDLYGSGEPAQQAVVGEQEWGTTSDIVYTLSAHDFNLFTGVEAPINGNTAARICSSGAVCGYLGGVQLPTGASIRAIELSACDTDAAQEVRVALFATPRVPSPLVFVVPFQGTGLAGVPGCSVFTFTLPTPHTVQNDANGYLVDILASPSANLAWNQVRIRYRLQVSPAPAVASFPNDVPTTHPFFRFIEAMAASGLTGGCGAGSFCPDAAVTRGQLAVFLASALGLHFPN